MYNLPLQTPPNAFSDTVGILRAPNSRNITVQVFNQGVYYQIGLGRVGVSSTPGAEVWEPQDGTFLAPGFWTFDQDDFYGGVAHAIRFRVAIIGLAQPATVVASA